MGQKQTSIRQKEQQDYRQNKRGDTEKWDQTDIPAIPDRGGGGHPRPPFGDFKGGETGSVSIRLTLGMLGMMGKATLWTLPRDIYGVGSPIRYHLGLTTEVTESCCCPYNCADTVSVPKPAVTESCCCP